MEYIISTHGTYLKNDFYVPNNITINFYVFHNNIMTMTHGYDLFRDLCSNSPVMPVETMGPNEKCYDYRLSKDKWATLQVEGIETHQDVNGIFKISDNGDLSIVYDDLFSCNNQALLSEVVNKISINTTYAVIHCLFCRK